ncbi:hypothetical protein ED857_19900, partial [Acinetobacter baumannii]
SSRLVVNHHVPELSFILGQENPVTPVDLDGNVYQPNCNVMWLLEAEDLEVVGALRLQIAPDL